LGQADLTLRYSHHEKGTAFQKKDLQVAAAEFVGTFFLAFIIAGTEITTNSVIQPFAIGCGYVALVYTLAPISGAQLNPCVTIGLVVREKLNLYEACYCIISQFLGATLAGGLCYAIYNNNWNKVLR
jgi:aquaporin Z